MVALASEDLDVVEGWLALAVGAECGGELALFPAISVLFDSSAQLPVRLSHIHSPTRAFDPIDDAALLHLGKLVFGSREESRGDRV
jgi:hypothetical protein